MIIKKFQAKTEEEAVSAARKEMGENVVIMSVRNLKKKGLFSFLKKPLVEVTVGMEEDTEKSGARSFTDYAKQNAGRSINRGMIKPGPDIIEEPEPVEAKPDKVIEQRLDNLQSLLEKQLVRTHEKDDFEKPVQEDSSVAFLKLI